MGNFLIFHNFMIFENLSTCFANISVMNFQKSKIWDVHFLRFFMLIVMRCFWFAVSYFFCWEIGVENYQFSSISILYLFLKILQPILYKFEIKIYIYIIEAKMNFLNFIILLRVSWQTTNPQGSQDKNDCPNHNAHSI